MMKVNQLNNLNSLWLKIMIRPFKSVFDWEHVLTPVAVEHRRVRETGLRTVRLVYIFGIRVAYYSTTKFQ